MANKKTSSDGSADYLPREKSPLSPWDWLKSFVEVREYQDAAFAANAFPRLFMNEHGMMAAPRGYDLEPLPERPQLPAWLRSRQLPLRDQDALWMPIRRPPFVIYGDSDVDYLRWSQNLRQAARGEGKTLRCLVDAFHWIGDRDNESKTLGVLVNSPNLATQQFKNFVNVMRESGWIQVGPRESPNLYQFAAYASDRRVVVDSRASVRFMTFREYEIIRPRRQRPDVLVRDFDSTGQYFCNAAPFGKPPIWQPL